VTPLACCDVEKITTIIEYSWPQENCEALTGPRLQKVGDHCFITLTQNQDEAFSEITKATYRRNQRLVEWKSRYTVYPLNEKRFTLKAQSWDLSRSCYFHAKRISLLRFRSWQHGWFSFHCKYFTDQNKRVIVLLHSFSNCRISFHSTISTNVR